jgi:hypothetical protein
MSTKWIIWYDDFSSFSSEDGEPWEAPREGVICIAIASIECGRYILSEMDWYCWHFESDTWVPHNRSGMQQYLRRPGKEKVVIEGYWVTKELYGKIRSHALKVDDRLPKVTAGGPRLPQHVREWLEE